VSDQPLVELGSLRYDADDGHVVGRAYVVVTDDVVVPSDGEVVDVAEIPLTGLDEWIEGRDVCFDSMASALPLLTTWCDSVGVDR